MDLIVGGIVFGVSLLLTVLCAWRGARPPSVMKGPRLVPWRFLMLMFAFVTLLSGIYLLRTFLAG